MDSDAMYPEQLTKRILARAVEIDHIRSAAYSLADLRTIAAEVGVSEAALEQAMRELRPADPQEPTRRSGALFAGALAGAGIVGAIGGVVDMNTYLITSPIVMGVLLMTSGGMAVTTDYSKPRRGLLRFLLRNSALWGVYVGSWLMAARLAGPELNGLPQNITMFIFARVVVLGWGLSTVFGGVVAALNARRSRGTHDGTAASPPPLRRRIADRLKHWLDIWASRIAVRIIPHNRGAHAQASR